MEVTIELQKLEQERAMNEISELSQKLLSEVQTDEKLVCYVFIVSD